jgi:hypothetical protein
MKRPVPRRRPEPADAPDVPAPNVAEDNGGLRFDGGKPAYDLIPPEAMDELALLYTIGARKYSDRNWERGMSFSRCFGPLMRHAWKFWRGEERDPETGIHHMIHAAWNAFALYVYVVRHIGIDDRGPQSRTRQGAREE